mmetsp:Transcript_29403/g.68172  ORF Transcript_29403/g.68172 Transcript_29403/m.68172 type:complete len:375 (+) Transcript_29403:16-1140(+)
MDIPRHEECSAKVKSVVPTTTKIETFEGVVLLGWSFDVLAVIKPSSLFGISEDLVSLRDFPKLLLCGFFVRLGLMLVRVPFQREPFVRLSDRALVAPWRNVEDFVVVFSLGHFESLLGVLQALVDVLLVAGEVVCSLVISYRLLEVLAEQMRLCSLHEGFNTVLLVALTLLQGLHVLAAVGNSSTVVLAHLDAAPTHTKVHARIEQTVRGVHLGRLGVVRNGLVELARLQLLVCGLEKVEHPLDTAVDGLALLVVRISAQALAEMPLRQLEVIGQIIRHPTKMQGRNVGASDLEREPGVKEHTICVSELPADLRTLHQNLQAVRGNLKSLVIVLLCCVPRSLILEIAGMIQGIRRLVNLLEVTNRVWVIATLFG